MSIALTTGLALRELWLSFRLLALAGLLAAPGLVALVAALDATFVAVAGWYAGAFGATGGLAAALGSATFAAERQRGGLAWLVAHAVPRGRLVLGWLTALAAVICVGIVPSALLAWLSLTAYATAVAQLDPLAFAATVAAAASDLLAWMAGGLLAGALLGPRLAAAATLLGVAGLLLIVTQFAALTAVLPAGGIVLLAELGTLSGPLAPAVQAVGIGLAAAGLLAFVGMAVMVRRDL